MLVIDRLGQRGDVVDRVGSGAQPPRADLAEAERFVEQRTPRGGAQQHQAGDDPLGHRRLAELSDVIEAPRHRALYRAAAIPSGSPAARPSGDYFIRGGILHDSSSFEAFRSLERVPSPGHGRAGHHPSGPRVHERSDDGNAFIPDPEGGPAHTSDDLAEILAEDFLQAATSGEDVAEESGDEVVPEELGGPFVETSAGEEFAVGHG